MIKVNHKREPSDFDSKVRQPGLTFLKKKGIISGGAVPSDFEFNNYWRNSLEDLFDDYDNICAYSGLRIEYLLGGASVDHYKPKAKYPFLAYEWSNYRLMASKLNSRKLDHEDILDPFEIENGWFQLDLVSGKVFPNPKLSGSIKDQIETTLSRLGLNETRFKIRRKEIVGRWARNEFGTSIVKEDAPFIYFELLRQGYIS